MTKCRKYKDMMMEALYGELGPQDKDLFDEHLRACPECASEYSVLGATLKVMGQRRRPDPGNAFWEGYWDRLAARMGKADSPRQERLGLPDDIGRFFSGLPRWSYQAAVGVALVVLGILIGRSLFGPQGPALLTKQSRGGSGVVDVANDPTVRAENLLDRSKSLLLALVNYDPKTQDLFSLDLVRKKELSRQLVSQAADIQVRLKDPRQRRLRELVADLEVILMQIGNLGAGNDLEGVELVRQGVEQKGLFLKIDLTRMARDAQASPKPASRPSEKAKI